MINTGVTFQPGTMDTRQPQTAAGVAPSSNPVQEAIKVLSLRLPKVVGARATAPNALLTSDGSGGNARVDSVVNQVWAKMFGEGQQQSAPSMPSAVPSSMPSFSGYGSPGGGQPTTSQPDYTPFPTAKPRVIVEGGGIGRGDFTVGPDGRPTGGGNVGGVIEELPGSFIPPPPSPPQPPQMPKWDAPIFSQQSAPAWDPLPSAPEPAFEI